MGDGLILVANVFGLTALIAGISVWVWLDQRGKTRRREMEHLERMRAIELGLPLKDDQVARYRALGAIGVAVPISSLSAAVAATPLLLMGLEGRWQVVAVLVVWSLCALACVTAVPAVTARLREGASRATEDQSVTPTGGDVKTRIRPPHTSDL